MSARVAVVPVAGLGTRLLPATKSQPKEMLPLVAKPVVQHVVEELHAAGLEQVLFVTGRGKDVIQDHFDPDAQLIRWLRDSGREGLLAELEYERMGMSFLYTRQHERRGLGDAVLRTQPYCRNTEFVLALGDSIIGRHGRSGAVRRLLEVFDQRRAAAVVLVEEVLPDEVHRYGIVAPAAGADGEVLELAGIVEKPPPAQAPSRLAVAARYVLAPAIFAALARTAPDAGGEVQLTDALRLLIDEGLPVVAVRLPADERRYDAGTVEGYCETFLEFALNDPRLGARLRSHTERLLREAGQG